MSNRRFQDTYPLGCGEKADRHLAAVSVIVCTYNGASRLRPTLDSLARCDADFPVEVIVVDNNSNDGTSSIARQAWDAAGNPDFKFTILHEPQRGQAFARRAGVRAAGGEIIVFCDDDNWLEPNYLKIAAEAMRDVKVGAVGGQCTPAVEGTVPNFLYSHGGSYALGIQGFETTDVTDNRGYLWGAGLTAHRSDLLSLYDCPGFPALRGRTGLSLTSGDDAEICSGLILLGRRLAYDERLSLTHFIPSHRLTTDYLSRLHAGFHDAGEGLGYYRVLSQLRSRSIATNVIRSGLRLLRSLIFGGESLHARFAFLAVIRLPALMNETQRTYYRIYRHLLSKVDNSRSRLLPSED